jgi:CysZ protein
MPLRRRLRPKVSRSFCRRPESLFFPARRHTCARMLEDAFNAFADLLYPPLRAVLIKSVLLALAIIAAIGIALQRVLASLAASGADWAEKASGFAPHSAWAALAWILSMMASLGILTGAVFLMPAVTNVIGSFFVDDVGDVIERRDFPADVPGRALPLSTAVIEGIKFGLLSLVVYVVALPFVLFAGFGFLIVFVANSYLLGRNFFELAAMRFYPPLEAKLLRRRHAGCVFLGGMLIALFVSVPILNLATPVFAMALMVRLHKRAVGRSAELIEAAR